MLILVFSVYRINIVIYQCQFPHIFSSNVQAAPTTDVPFVSLKEFLATQLQKAQLIDY